VYQLDARLTDQDGNHSARTEARPARAGRYVLYLVRVRLPAAGGGLRNTEAGLTAQERARLRVLLITIDPVRDTVAVLKRTAGERGIDSPRWTWPAATWPPRASWRRYWDYSTGPCPTAISITAPTSSCWMDGGGCA
jgi:hypothetical protein